MQVKKVIAKNIRLALLRVKEELGSEATILSTRSIEHGVEVVAGIPKSAEPAPARAKVQDTDSKAEIGEMRSELHSIRSLLQQRLDGMAWGQFAKQSPAQAAVWERLAAMGLPGSVNQRLLDEAGAAPALDQLWRQVMQRLIASVSVEKRDPLENGGVFVLMGPTGAGKSTTVAKLATRHVLQHGPDSIALVTTDGSRLAAHEQLRTVGRILGVTVRVVDSHYTLADALEELHDKRVVLVDTAGLASSHPYQQEQFAMIERESGLTKWLVLPCTSQAAVLRKAYRACAPLGISGCILTRLDEAGALGDALSVVIEQSLPVVFEAFGQGIPDDVVLAQSERIIKRAVMLGRQQAGSGPEQERLAADYAKAGYDRIDSAPGGRTVAVNATGVLAGY